MNAWIMKIWIRYAILSALVAGLVAAGGWVLLPDELRRGVALAIGVVLPVQLMAFAGLLRWPSGTRRFLAAWVGGMVLRLVVVAVTAIAVAGREARELVTILLTMVGLFFVLLLMEPWMLRKQGTRGTNG